MSKLDIKFLGVNVAYADAMELQNVAHAARCDGKIPDTLLLLEHKPVYTLGRSADPSHVLMSTEALEKAGIDVVQTNRGGDVTYHGPGQLVGYPIINLRERGMGVVDYVTAIEEVIIQSLYALGLHTAGRNVRNRGVWVADSKICAIGIRVSHQVTMHGFALNVNTKLSDFSGIIPCGLTGVGVTSLAEQLDHHVDMTVARDTVAATFARVFGCEFQMES